MLSRAFLPLLTAAFSFGASQDVDWELPAAASQQDHVESDQYFSGDADCSGPSIKIFDHVGCQAGVSITCINASAYREVIWTDGACASGVPSLGPLQLLPVGCQSERATRSACVSGALTLPLQLPGYVSQHVFVDNPTCMFSLSTPGQMRIFSTPLGACLPTGGPDFYSSIASCDASANVAIQTGFANADCTGFTFQFRQALRNCSGFGSSSTSFFTCGGGAQDGGASVSVIAGATVAAAAAVALTALFAVKTSRDAITAGAKRLLPWPTQGAAQQQPLLEAKLPPLAATA